MSVAYGGVGVVDEVTDWPGHDAPCAFRNCETRAAWVGTPLCRHSQLFCTAHMLHFTKPHVLAHCTVCRDATPAAALTWKEYRP